MDQKLVDDPDLSQTVDKAIMMNICVKKKEMDMGIYRGQMRVKSAQTIQPNKIGKVKVIIRESELVSEEGDELLEKLPMERKVIMFQRPDEPAAIIPELKEIRTKGETAWMFEMHYYNRGKEDKLMEKDAIVGIIETGIKDPELHEELFELYPEEIVPIKEVEKALMFSATDQLMKNFNEAELVGNRYVAKRRVYTAEEIDDRRARLQPIFEADLLKNNQLTPEQIRIIRERLMTNHDLFQVYEDDLGDAGPEWLMEVDTGDVPPIKVARRRFDASMMEAIKAMIDDFKRRGIVRNSNSPWASALCPVRKKDGSIRMCIDFRRLNDATRKDNFLLPTLQELIDKLGQSKPKFLTSIDLNSGYHQLRMHPKSIPKTAFSTPF